MSKIKALFLSIPLKSSATCQEQSGIRAQITFALRHIGLKEYEHWEGLYETMAYLQIKQTFRWRIGWKISNYLNISADKNVSGDTVLEFKGQIKMMEKSFICE